MRDLCPFRGSNCCLIKFRPLYLLAEICNCWEYFVSKTQDQLDTAFVARRDQLEVRFRVNVSRHIRGEPAEPDLTVEEWPTLERHLYKSVAKKTVQVPLQQLVPILPAEEQISIQTTTDKAVPLYEVKEVQASWSYPVSCQDYQIEWGRPSTS